MEIELSDVSGLPEALKSLAKEAGGKFSLDLSQVAPMADLERFKAKAVTAESEAIDRRKALKAWDEFGTPDDIRAKLAKGADPEIIKQMQTQMAEKESAYSAKLTGILRQSATADLKAELAKAGVVPEGLDLLAGFASSRIQFTDDGAVKVLTADGSGPMIGGGANGGATLADLAKQLAASIPHLVADRGAGGGGKQPGSGGTPHNKTIKREAFLALSPAEQASQLKAGVTPID